MTKNDYIKIAAVIAGYRLLCEASTDKVPSHWHGLLNNFVDILKADNPNFNAAKFIEACEK